MHNCYSFLTSALCWGEWSLLRPHGELSPWKGPSVHLDEAGWASEPVWTQGVEEKSFIPSGDRTQVVQSVVTRRFCRRSLNFSFIDSLLPVKFVFTVYINFILV
jgi:hypothetical protein